MSVYRIQYGGIVGKPINYSEFLCDSIEDITLLPTNINNTNTYGICSIGSIAYVNGIKYILNNSGVWEIKNNININQDSIINKQNIEDYLFRNITSYNNRFIHKIGDHAFYRFTAMNDISLPNATSIGTYAFYNCNSLENIYLPNSEESYEYAPWGAINATIHYNCEFDENGIYIDTTSTNENGE